MKFRDMIQGDFEVYSVVSGEALSTAMDIDAAMAEQDKMAVGAGFDNFNNGAVDIRRVVVAI